MPLPVAGLIVGFFLASITSIIGRILWVLGISVFYITGLTVLLDTLYDSIQQELGSLGLASVQYLSLMKVDVAISIVFSAVTLRMLIKVFGGNRSATKTRAFSAGS